MDHIDVRIYGHAEGCGEEGCSGGDDGWHTSAVRDCYSRLFIPSSLSFLLEPACHQDGVVNGGTQLDGAQDNACYKGNRCSRVEFNGHVDKDGKFDGRFQNHRQREGLEHEQNNEEDNSDGCRVYVHEVHIRDIHQIMGQRSFADQHAVGVILLQDFVDVVDLRVYFVGACVVLAADKGQRVFITLQHALCFCRNHGIRNFRSYQGADADAVVYTVHVVNLIQDSLLVLCRKILVHQNHMHGTAAEVILQLCLRNAGRKGFRKRTGHIVVIFHVVVAVQSRNKHHREDDQPDHPVLCDKIGQPVGIPQKRSVRGFGNQLVKNKNQRRKDGHAA